MNIKYKILSKDLYKLVKKEEYWDDKDLDIVDKFAKMIKDEVAKVKRAEAYLSKKENKKEDIIESVGDELKTLDAESGLKITDATELINNIALSKPKVEDLMLDEKPTTIFERIYDEDELNANILAKKENDEKKVVVQEIDPNELKRYIIHIETYGEFIQDTKFQKFISNKVNNKDFMTDQVLNTLTTYIAIIDEKNESEIRRKITPMLSSVHVFKIIPVANNFILPQYKNVWNYQTLI